MQFNELRPFIISITPRRYMPETKRTGQAQHWLLLYISSGAGEIRFNGRRGEALSAGSAALLPPGTTFVVKALGGDMSGILIQYDLTPDMTTEQIVSTRVEDRPSLNEACVITGAEQIGPWLENGLDVHMRHEPTWQIDVAAICMRSLNVVTRLAESHTHYLVDQVIDVISQRYNEPLGNGEIAQILGKHPNYINAVFVRDMGMSIHQYVMRYRIEKAGQLLLTTQLPVSEVAKEVGFRHFSHFSNCFHKLTGCAPATYRVEK